MLKEKGFFPYILVVFFNAFVDLGHKILLQNTVFTTTTAHEFTILSSILNALMLLPYIFLFTPSGFIADRFSKAVVLRISAAAAIPITMLITFFYFMGYFWAAFICTLLFATQSAINSPAKYGYIKEMFGKEQIAKANAWVQTTVMVAILAGILSFTWLFSYLLDGHLATIGSNKSLALQYFYPLGFILIGLSITETLLTLRIIKQPAADPNSHYPVAEYFKGSQLKNYLSSIKANRITFTCIIGLSIFWAVSQVLLASYGAYLKTYIPGVTTNFVQNSMGVALIGVLLGAIYAGRVSRGFIETGIIPIATIGLTITLFFFPNVTNKAIIVSLFLAFGFFGGMLSVPLNALIQFNAKNTALGKTMAANNFIQNIFMVSFLGVTVITTLLGSNSIYILYALFAVALGGTVYAFKRLPQALIRFVIYFLVSKFYRIEVQGLDDLPSQSGALLLGNHISYLDWAILQIASPRPIRFVMDRSIYEKWYLNWFLSHFNMIPISRGGAKASIKAVNEALKNGDVVAIFPEGYLSRNGQLGEFHTGFEHMIKGTGAIIVPFYLQGLWGSSSSYAPRYVKQQQKQTDKTVHIYFGTPLPENTDAATLKQTVTLLSTRTWDIYADNLKPIAYEWLKTAKRTPHVLCVADSSGLELTHKKCLAGTYQLSRQLARPLQGQQNVGVLLPTITVGCLTNMALLCLGKTLVNLNYTSGVKALEHAIDAANIKTIITSRLFVKRLTAKGVDFDTFSANTNVIYLEDLKKSKSKLLFALRYTITRILPEPLLRHIIIERHDLSRVAAILFSSGSEGTPKGIELTHKNLLTNAKQIACVFNIEENDVLLNSLPLFHAFGLTVSTVMPMIEGVPFVCNPDPTDAVNIGKLAYRYKATVMCATATFLGLYTRNSRLKAPMFTTLRFVIAGAEKLPDAIRTGFTQKFNVPIFEGYGATETSPVASTNLPDIINPDDWHLHVSNKIGTVGLPLPGTAFRIVDPVTLNDLPTEEAGLILIGGPQVMKGYLNNPLKSDSVLYEDQGIRWYKTGDKGFLDKDGFLTIVDRYSRFAKIGGEMVSLSAVEGAIHPILSAMATESDLMAVALPDDKKGERIVLLYEADVAPDALKAAILNEKIEALMLPSKFIQCGSLPRLGSGKKDYTQAKVIANK